MILKEWSAKKAIREINFDTSTFFIQVHGLPPTFLDEKSARLIGSKIGEIRSP